MGDVETESAGVLLQRHLRLTCRLIFETDFRSWDLEIPAQKVTQSRTATGKVQAIFLEVKVVGASKLVGGKNFRTGIWLCFVQPDAPHIDMPREQRRRYRAFSPFVRRSEVPSDVQG